jgi:hypothetical protein
MTAIYAATLHGREKFLLKKQEFTGLQCGASWLRAEFLRGPFSILGNGQVEIPILRAAAESYPRLPLMRYGTRAAGVPPVLKHGRDGHGTALVAAPPFGGTPLGVGL